MLRPGSTETTRSAIRYLFANRGNDTRNFGRRHRRADRVRRCRRRDRDDGWAIPGRAEPINEREHLVDCFEKRVGVEDLRADVATNSFDETLARLRLLGHRRLPLPRYRCRICDRSSRSKCRDASPHRHLDSRGSATRARVFKSAGDGVDDSSSSPSDSQLKMWMPLRRAYSISSAVFPTPEKTTFAGSPPALMHTEEFAAGDDVEARAGFGEQSQNVEVRIRFDRVADLVRKVTESVVIGVKSLEDIGR